MKAAGGRLHILQKKDRVSLGDRLRRSFLGMEKRRSNGGTILDCGNRLTMKSKRLETCREKTEAIGEWGWSMRV
jgi:hypothetical protein